MEELDHGSEEKKQDPDFFISFIFFRTKLLNLLQ